VADDLGGLGGGCAPGIPGGEEAVAEPVGLGSDGGRTGVSETPGVSGVEGRLPAGSVRCGQPVGVACLTLLDVAQEIAP
jgi:hypothetical protein